MIDTGLLISVAVIVAVLWSLSRRFPPRTLDPREFTDTVLVPVFSGIAAARLTAVAIDNPSGLTRIRDLIIVRSGMEFWAGVAAATLAVAVSAYRRDTNVVQRLADLSPYALAGYAIFEATCVLRDGCFGPASPVGLTPSGLTTRMLPLGLLVGAVVTAAAFLVRRLASNQPLVAILVGLAALALSRAAASFWLPRLGDALTRQHTSSIVVAAAATTLALLTQLNRTREIGTP